MKPIEITVPWLPKGVGAITLWPFIVYKTRALRDRYREHELFHWRQALRWGVVPWYIAYIALMPFYGDPRAHPMEREAYRVSDDKGSHEC